MRLQLLDQVSRLAFKFCLTFLAIYITTKAILYIQRCVSDVDVYCAGNLRLAVMLPEGEDING